MTQAEFFAYVIDVLEGLNIKYMITGSVASMIYGEPRMTLDMDIVVQMLPDIVEKFCSRFNSDFYVDMDMVQEAIQERGYFNIIHVPSGSKVDFYQVKLDSFNQEAFKRRHREALDEIRLAAFSSPEDVIVNKLIFYKEGKSEKHITDIRAMLRVSGEKIDIPYIDKKAKELDIYQYWEEAKRMQ